jgi:molybdate transport system substrate-binding protein
MTANEFSVMTSGAFTAAHLALIPQLERLTGKKVVTVTTSWGTGDTSIPSRLKRGEIADLVIVADEPLHQLIDEGLVLSGTDTPLVRSLIGMAVRAGAAKPDISTIDALKHTLLKAKSIAYSASVSGKYLTTELYQRLGIADQCLGKSRLIGGGERVGAVVARGEAELGFQQMSELLPVPGIAHITPLPPGAQIVTTFSAGIAATAPDAELARLAIRFLASPETAKTIISTGLEPAGIK